VIVTRTRRITERLQEIAPNNVLDALEEKRQDDRTWFLDLNETGGTANVTLTLMIPTPEFEAWKNGIIPEGSIPCFCPSDEKQQLTFTVEP
jgi:hypothetical protein